MRVAIQRDSPKSLDDILDHFHRVKKNGAGWKAECPAHADKVQSLAITEKDGKILLKCHAGCETEDVLERADLTYADLFSEPLPEPIPMRQRTIAATYDYTSEDGDILFQVVRYDPKDFRQRTPDSSAQGGWRYNMQGTRRVLYRLTEILESDPRKPVFLCAGEKDADNVRALGLIATTNPMGEGKWLPEYSESLRGRHVVVLCDNDVAGIKHGSTVRDALKGIAKSVHVIHFPELPEHGDVSDWITLGNGRKDLLDRVKAEREERTNAGKPVFPVDIFPDSVREFVTIGGPATNTPTDMVAVPFLSVAAAAIGNSVEISLKASWQELANIWTVVVGEPGSGKSPANTYAMKPLKNLQDEAFDLWKNKKEMWDAEFQSATAKEKKELPPPPEMEHFFTNDATIEGTVKILGSGTGILVERDEIMAWVQSHDQYKKGGDRANYLSMWSGKGIKKDRSGEGTIYVKRPVMPITGGTQPDMLPEIAGEARKDDGFIDRFLFTWPDASPSTEWTEDDRTYDAEQRVTDLFRTIRSDVPRGDTVTLRLSPDAKDTFISWWKENNAITKSSHGLVAGFYAKLNSYCARFALILHVLHNAGTKNATVSKETIEDAITLAEYFRSYLNVILPSFDTAPSMASAGKTQRIMRAISRTPGEWVTRKELMDRLGNNIPAKELGPILDDLDATGAVEQRSAKADGPGRPKLEVRATPEGTSEWVV